MDVFYKLVFCYPIKVERKEVRSHNTLWESDPFLSQISMIPINKPMRTMHEYELNSEYYLLLSLGMQAAL
jgi:hypothetical protein